MFIPDPAQNDDQGRLGERWRSSARNVCRLVGGAVGLVMFVANRLAPVSSEPFLVLGVVVMLLALLLSYVF